MNLGNISRILDKLLGMILLVLGISGILFSIHFFVERPLDLYDIIFMFLIMVATAMFLIFGIVIVIMQILEFIIGE